MSYTRRSLLLLLIPCTLGQVILHSPRMTNWGTWREFQDCPPYTFAAGFDVLMEGAQGIGDDTALNAVSLVCLEYNWKEECGVVHTSGTSWISTDYGPFGTWQGNRFCPPGQFIIGFQLRAESEGSADNTGAVNFRAFCGCPFQPQDHTSIEGSSPDFGVWTEAKFCPEGHAICGINGQVQSYLGAGTGDDTALNNIDVRCCKIDVDCKPDVMIKTLESHNNRDGAGEMKFSFTVKSSFVVTTRESSSISKSEKTIISQKISSMLGAADGGLSSKIAQETGITLEKASVRTWQSMLQQTVLHSTEKTFAITIPPGKFARIKQVFFTCGKYELGIAETIVSQN